MTDDNSSLYFKPIPTRRPTDKFFVLLFPINFLLWLGIGIYEICKYTGEEVRPRYHDQILPSRFLHVTIYGIVSAIVITSFLFVITKLKVDWIILAVISLIIVAIFSILTLIPWQLITFINADPKSYSLPFIILFALTILSLTYQITIFICTKEISMSILLELISKSRKVIFRSYVVLLFSLVVAFLSIIVLMLTINISLSKRYNDFSEPASLSRVSGYSNLFRICIFFIGGIYTFNFIWNFGLIVVADYSANFYATLDNHEISQTYVFQSITRVVRYHLGTVAFLSIPFLPSICALIMAFKTEQQFKTNHDYKLINCISKICLIADISDYALTQTSIYGYKALKSIAEMIDLHQRSSLLFLTLNAVSKKIIEIGIVIAIIIGMIIRICFLPSSEYVPLSWCLFSYPVLSVEQRLIICDIFMTAIYVNFMCKCVMRPGMCVFSIYQMNGVRMSETLENHFILSEQSI